MPLGFICLSAKSAVVVPVLNVDGIGELLPAYHSCAAGGGAREAAPVPAASAGGWRKMCVCLNLPHLI